MLPAPAPRTPRSPASAPCPRVPGGGPSRRRGQFAVANRLDQHTRTPATARTRKTRPCTCPRLHRQPHATPQCTIADFATDTCPIDSQVASSNELGEAKSPSSRPSTTSIPPPDVAGLIAFKILSSTPRIHGPQLAHQQRLRPRCHRHLDLPWGISSSGLQRGSLGSPADPRHDPPEDSLKVRENPRGRGLRHQAL